MFFKMFQMAQENRKKSFEIKSWHLLIAKYRSALIKALC